MKLNYYSQVNYTDWYITKQMYEVFAKFVSEIGDCYH